MIRDLFLSLLSGFVIEPFLADLNAKLTVAEVPQAITEQVQACAAIAPQALAERAAADPWWGITAVIGVAVGMVEAEAALAETAPACASAIAAVRPFVTGSGA